jgi:hypothetical protein
MVKERRIAIVFTLTVAFCFAVMAFGSNNVFADEDIDLVIKKLNQSRRILKNKVLPRLGVPKTGQTTSYATDDDGDLQKGTPWPDPRFTDNGDGTVTDKLTDLIWLKNANRFGAITWADALNECNVLADDGGELTDGSVAGDWRLPNVRELQSLIHYAFMNPALSNTAGTGPWTSGDPFTAVQMTLYWTSTAHVNNPTGAAWCVALNSGYLGTRGKSENQFTPVWPVRGGN